jgi:hypothetical protein
MSSDVVISGPYGQKQLQVLVPEVLKVQVNVVVATVPRTQVDTAVAFMQTGTQPERATVIVQVVAAEEVQLCTPT